MQYRRQFTGSWLANYGCLQDRRTREVVFPRVAYSLPATRHLLVAIAMLDERLNDPSPELLMARSRKILHHYNQAIHQLILYNPSMVDTIASSLLAWVLETCLHDTTRAIMHLDASSRLLERVQADGLRDYGTEDSGLILNHLKRTRDGCAGYCSTERRLACPRFRDQTCIFTVLVTRHGPQQMRSTKDARDVLEKYFATSESSQGIYMSSREARDFLRVMGADASEIPPCLNRATRLHYRTPSLAQSSSHAAAGIRGLVIFSLIIIFRVNAWIVSR